LQQDILAAQVQLSQLMDEKIRLEGKSLELSAVIGELLSSGEPYDANLIKITAFQSQQKTTSLPTIEELQRKSLEQNPRLHARIAAREKSSVMVSLANKDFGTDMNFRVGYGQREDDPLSGTDRADFFSASVTFSLPVWQNKRQHPKLNGSRARLAAASKAVSSYTITLEHQIEGLLAAISTARENYDLFNNALTLQAEQLEEASLAAYSVGEVEFNTMLNTRIQTLRYKLQAEKYRYQELKKHAELEELLGEPVFLLHEANQNSSQPETKEKG